MSSDTTPAQLGVDVRGPRFAAWLTTGVLGLVLIISAVSPVAAAVALGIQAVVFAVGAAFGPRRHPYGLLFSTFVSPRLSPVREREPVPPLKFAQLVGFVFAVCGIIGFAVGPVVVGVVATSFALAAAFLNAAFGICLGCQLYPLLTRLRRGALPA
ncbi:MULTISPECIES: DUF4395 domain-containing protein [Mycobacterium]|uniref:DUF4395 domain-containing protein n=1 Tax=Mycobacterium persicum TaxID=1487726 RepID=A0A1X0L9E1_9MYCO|nr:MULTISPECIES: DUF4395 domain-containing protein [Mycobacterium]ARG63009.1 hypothetical protein B1T45_18770 [Mycobacterium kansasii]KZS80566.1 hypothetical protein A4G31_09855 [Mycobacterium persicum]ORB38023.1 hypothetical protein BST40_23220 [Mycobacterium persicum]ORB89539.1 hypothetical protein B1T49_10230 [Mycobacterium persicum]ORB94988.1 hypothetical protein B1T44_11255 [Mycobacterium persicum]